MGLHEWPLMFFTVIGQSVKLAPLLLWGAPFFRANCLEVLNRKVHYSMFGL